VSRSARARGCIRPLRRDGSSNCSLDISHRLLFNLISSPDPMPTGITTAAYTISWAPLLWLGCLSSRSASSSRPGANRDYCRCTRGTSHALTPVCVVQECLELQAASTRCAGGGSADSSVNISGAGFSSIQLLRLTKCQQGSELLRAVSLALHALNRVCFVHRCLDLLPFLSTYCDLLSGFSTYFALWLSLVEESGSVLLFPRSVDAWVTPGSLSSLCRST